MVVVGFGVLVSRLFVDVFEEVVQCWFVVEFIIVCGSSLDWEVYLDVGCIEVFVGKLWVFGQVVFYLVQVQVLLWFNEVLFGFVGNVVCDWVCEEWYGCIMDVVYYQGQQQWWYC